MKRISFFLLTALLLTAPAKAQENHNFETAKHLDIFNALYRNLDLYYVDTLNAEKNIGNAISYMLNQLDPYTEYYKEENTTDLKQMTTGKYAGIGSPIIYRKGTDRCVFDSPYEGMPAQRAGVRSGDIIMAIDGRDVGPCGAKPKDDYSGEVSAALRGEPGTTFTLTVERPGVGEKNFRITRETIKRPSVAYQRMADDSIGYVMLDSYTKDTSKDLRRAIVELKQKGARRLVLDLRGNPGGLMDQAVSVAGFFLPRGVEVLQTKGKVLSMNATYKTTEEPLDEEMPVAVLVDYGTASAAEITSGALQDYDRAVIVGRRTYGKGLVQEPRQLPYNTLLKLTTSKYYIPSGRCIQAYDFKNRGADGQPQHLPDSLCKTFKTAAGRPVRDGGGITPDIDVKPDSLPGLIPYLDVSDALFDYCVRYRNSHDTIATPDRFALTDEEFADFKAFMAQSDFTYDNRTKSALGILRQIARSEGYAERAAAEFDALEAKLQHNLTDDLDIWQKEVRATVEATIVGMFYHERGVAEYNLRDDKDFQEALKVLRDDAKYRAILAAPQGD